MSVSIFIDPTFWQISKIDHKFEFSKKYGVLIYKYMTAFLFIKTNHFLWKKKLKSVEITWWIEPDIFSFTFFTLLFNKFWTVYLLVISRLTLSSLLKVDQNQIFFSIIPKFEGKIFLTMTMQLSSDPLSIRRKVSGDLRYFKPCRIKVF